MELLGHKGHPWTWQIQRCLTEQLDPLTSDFYAIWDQERPVANLCITSVGQLAILGHVYVHPDHRRRGYAQRLLERALVGRDEQRIYLGTEPDSSAERLYRQAGFSWITPGFMVRGPQQPISHLTSPLTLEQWPQFVHWGAHQPAPENWEGLFLELLAPSDPMHSGH